MFALVDVSEIPDYCVKVRHPMDFTTIRKKLEVRSCVELFVMRVATSRRRVFLCGKYVITRHTKQSPSLSVPILNSRHSMMKLPGIA